jgi:uncharacterized spore protein YtfJ
VKFPDVLDQLPNDRTVRRVFGEPYVTPEGVTVIPVARIKQGTGKRRSGSAEDDQDGQDFHAGHADGFTGVPLGVFVVQGDDTYWVPAVDINRVALIGVLTGLLAAVIGSLAVLRQPPWPRITITGYR